MNGELGDVAVYDAEALYRTHREELIGMARVMCGSPSMAEEVVQEVFVSLQDRRPTIQRGHERAYLRRAVLNQVRGRWRRRSTARRHLHSAATESVENETPEQSAIESARRARIDDAIRGLSARQRECIALRYFTDLTEPAIAKELGISVGAVKSHLHRGRESLAISLGDLNE